jgi:hypothetical protein
MNHSEINSLFINVIEGSKRTSPETLPLWLAAHLTHYDYDRLSDILDISEKKLTRLFSGVDAWCIREYTLLYTFLTMKFADIPHPADFIRRFNISNDIRIDDMENLSKWYDGFKELQSSYYTVDRSDQTPQDYVSQLETIEKENVAWTGFKIWILNYLNAA